MPIFEFNCNKCEKTVEKIISYEESEKPIKCDCGKGKLIKKTITPFNFKLKGRWFKTSKGY